MSSFSEKQPHKAQVLAIIAAAGKGQRMRHSGGKQMIKLEGIPIIRRTCQIFEENPWINNYLVAASAAELETISSNLEDFKQHGKCLAVIMGGDSRQDTVAKSLRFLHYHLDRASGGGYSRRLPDERIICLVHDGARCLLSQSLLSRVIVTILQENCVVAPALAVSDTLRRVEEGVAPQLIPREHVYAMQTPQGAELDAFITAYTKLQTSEKSVTDDVEALLAAGYPLQLVEGEARNLKLTRPQDLELARFYLSEL